MSREAMEAVQDHSTIADPYGRLVFIAIARFVGPNGEPGYPSIRTIAEKAGCDKNTVTSWTAKIEAAGELTTRKEGKGRGTRIYYTINLPFDSDNNGGMYEPSSDNNGSDNNELMSESENLMSEKIDLLSEQIALMSERMSDIVLSLAHTETRNRRETEETEEETNAHARGKTPSPSPKQKPTRKGPPTPASREFGYQNNASNPELSPADRRLQAIADACGLDLEIPAHRNEAENASSQLKSYTAEYIQERYAPGGWWYLNDWRGKKRQQPTASQVVETIVKNSQPPPQRPLRNSRRPIFCRNYSRRIVLMDQVAEIARRVFPGRQWQQPQPTRQRPAERVTLDTLSIDNHALEMAVKAARGWAKRKNEGARDASLILSGPVGTGKTHIAKAILWSIYNSLDDGTPVAPAGRFYIADDLIQAMEPGVRPGTMIPQDCPVLVIDDAGSEQSVPYVATEQQANEIQNRYFKVVDYCYTWQISIVITTNLTLNELGGRVGKRCWSRLQQMAPAGFMVDMTGVPDWRRKQGGR